MQARHVAVKLYHSHSHTAAGFMSPGGDSVRAVQAAVSKPPPAQASTPQKKGQLPWLYTSI